MTSSRDTREAGVAPMEGEKIRQSPARLWGSRSSRAFGNHKDLAFAGRWKVSSRGQLTSQKAKRCRIESSLWQGVGGEGGQEHQ